MSCANACPRDLIVAVPYDNHVFVPCASHAKGAVTVRSCSQGCVGCSMCKKICPNDAITIEKNLAIIDYSKCDSCGLCATVCPKKLIVNTKPLENT
jgi:formate hydrogenlyase subunit 6/NADH:ubiquinone oxidoreductase subunit I